MSTYDNGAPMPDVWLVESKPSPFPPRAVHAAEFKREADAMAEVLAPIIATAVIDSCGTE